MTAYGEDLFKGTAHYYSRYRPMYPASLIRFLIEKFSLDGSGKMLDLSCGTGQLAHRFSDWFEGIVGIDREPEMIDEAIRLSKVIRAENVKWFTGDIDTYKENSDETFQLVTIAKAFHWMDRAKVLDTLDDMVACDGGIAIIDTYSSNKELLPWQKKVDEVVKRWYGNERRAGNTTYAHPTISHQTIISNSNFDLEIHEMPTYEQIWTVDAIIGNIYSTSYGTKRFLGENVWSFEEHIKEKLLALDDTGVYKEQLNVSVKLAVKRK